MPDDDDTRTSSSLVAPVGAAIAMQPNATQQPGFWRWLARAALSLWWLFVVALAAGTASYLGNHAGPALIPLLPRLLDWARGQSLAVRAGLVLAGLLLLAVMAWLTVLAWRQRQRRVVEEVQAATERQTSAFEGALDRGVNPRLDGIRADVRQAVTLGQTIKDRQDTLLDVATATHTAVVGLQQDITERDQRAEHASATKRVFVSGTFVDLRAYRKRLYDALVDMYQLPVDMVDFGAGGGDATKVSKEEVANSDLFVLIVAWRYGVIPIGAAKSITEQEYDEAARLRKPIFVFLADPSTEADDGPDALFPAAVRMPEHAQLLDTFRALLRDPNYHTYKTFTTPEDLALKVQTALYRYLLRSGAIGSDPAGPPFQQAALPLPEKTFVGRQADLDWLLPRLRAGGGETAITAIDGLGGVGKSTLAAVAVHDLAAQGAFPDGIAVVDCLGLGHDDTVGVLRGALDGFAHQAAQEATDLAALTTLATRALTGKRALIVLDNVEPELDITAVLQRLRPTGVTLLLTARQRLPVPRDALRELALLSEAAALDLFAEWYGRANAAALTPGEHAAATRIVSALGRHTLAVKLAAAEAADGVAHLDDQSPDAVARWLAGFAAEKAAHPLDIQGLDADATQTLKDNLMRSVTSLPTGGALGDVRRLFAALDVFNAPVLASTVSTADTRSAAADGSEHDRVPLVPSLEFGRQAMVAVATGLGLPAPERAVDLLVRRALIERSTATALPDAADRERLRLHPLLRELAAELLDDPTRAAASLAIANFYAEYANETSRAALVPDAENIAGALEWAHEHAPDEDRDVLIALICSGMSNFWRDRSRTRDSLRYLPWGVQGAETLLDDAGNACSPGDTTVDQQGEKWQRRADRLSWLTLYLGYAYQVAGRLDPALARYERGLRVARTAQSRRAEGAALSFMGQIAWFRGQLAQAEGYFQQALAICREVQDRLGEGVALTCLGQIAQRRGRLGEAEGYLQQALAIYRKAQNLREEGVALGRLGQIAQDRGQLAAAEAHFQQALAIHREVQNRRDEGVDLESLGQIAQARGRLEEAEGYLKQALAIHREVQNRRDEGVVLMSLGQIARDTGKLDEAEDYFGESLTLMRHVQDVLNEGRGAQILGTFLIVHRGNRDEGCALIGSAVRIFHHMGVPDEQAARELAHRLGCDVGE